MVIVLVGIGVEEILGGILFLIGLVGLVIMSGTSNYTDIGFCMGFTILGFIALQLSVFLSIMMMKSTEDDKLIKNTGKICLCILAAAAIFGYFYQAYSNTFHIVYSNIMSIFVTPLPIYIIMTIFLLWRIDFLDGAGEILGIIIFIAASMVMFIMAGVGVIGVNYFLGNTDFLNWADQNFKYENRIMLSHRNLEYGTDNFKTILEVDLENAKKYYFETKKYDAETAKKEFLAEPYLFEYELGEYQPMEDNANIYKCTFIDKAQYAQNGEFPRYYAKIDLATFSVIETLGNQADSKDDSENKFVKNVEKAKKVTTNEALKYVCINLKNNKAEITKDNINILLKYLRANTATCDEVIENENNTVLVTMSKLELPDLKKGEFLTTSTQEKFVVDKTTYEISYYE